MRAAEMGSKVASAKYLKATITDLAQKHGVTVLDVLIEPDKLVIKMNTCDYDYPLPVGEDTFYRLLDNTFAHHDFDTGK
jgi:hypothetical protein